MRRRSAVVIAIEPAAAADHAIDLAELIVDLRVGDAVDPGSAVDARDAIDTTAAGQLGITDDTVATGGTHAADAAHDAADATQWRRGQTAGVMCPQICGEGTLCQMPDGSCGEACNPCLCQAHGGTVVRACPK